MITLVSGRRYYIEAIQAEGSGGDNLGVAWRTPLDAADPIDGDPPIPGKYLSGFGFTPGPVSITTPPANRAAIELLPVTFTVTPGGSAPYSFQWLRNGTAIPGATGQSYSIARTPLTDHQAKFSVQVNNPFSTATSSEATLTVTADNTAPVLLGAKGLPNRTEVVLTFSERINPVSASIAANYQIGSAGGNLSVTAAVLSADATKVTLTTALQTLGTKYIITVNNLADPASTPNVIAPNSKAGFFPTGKIVEDANGFIVFEAENFDRNLDGLWVRDTTRANPSGGASMVLPNGAGGSETASQLEYDIEFKQSGPYKVWYLASGNDGADDSGWFYLDGAKPAERLLDIDASMTGFSGALDFVWRSDAQTGADPFTVEIAAAGMHVVGLARREDGSFFDKFIITTDTAYTPTGFGPPETRGGAPGLPTVTITEPTNGQTFATGANVTLKANASGATGIAITRIEFLANGNKVGQASSAPFSFTWNNVPQGLYLVTANAIDEVGGSTLSAPVRITVGNAPPEVLYVKDNNAAPNASDMAAIARLESMGFFVTTRGALASLTSDADGKVLIVVSSTIPSGDVGNKYQTVPVAIVNWEQALQDNLLMTGDVANTDRESILGQTDIEIVNASHPLAAGLSVGVLTVASSVVDFSWGLPTNGAVKIASVPGDATKFPIYAYERGALMIGGVPAPARRVNFLLTDNAFLGLNGNGLKLFDAAIRWAADLPTGGTAPSIGIARETNGTLTIIFTGRLEASDSLTPASWQTVPGSGSVNVQPTGQAKFYRAANP